MTPAGDSARSPTVPGMSPAGVDFCCQWHPWVCVRCASPIYDGEVSGSFIHPLLRETFRLCWSCFQVWKGLEDRARLRAFLDFVNSHEELPRRPVSRQGAGRR